MANDEASEKPTDASRAPVRMSSYTLSVRDIGRCSDFYQSSIGLQVLDRGGDLVVLGVGGVPLLRLEQHASAMPDDPKTAGLHHLAFLMPTRRNLADWHRHARQIGLTITRTGDHHVNEALYFDDPEGNGCECYADRPEAHWQWDANGKVYIPTTPVDLENLRRDESPHATTWQAPGGLRIGHINLRVGDLDASETFYCNLLGLDHTCRREAMTFMSSGRYHHHLAANIFTSRGAGRRDDARAGLVWFAFEHDHRFDAAAARDRLRRAGAPVTELEAGFEARDPWGTRVRVVRA